MDLKSSCTPAIPFSLHLGIHQEGTVFLQNVSSSIITFFLVIHTKKNIRDAYVFKFKKELHSAGAANTLN
jgi:hypothetical protein